MAGVTRLVWLIEVNLASRSEGLGWPGNVDKSVGFGWARLTQGLPIKVRGWRAGLAQVLALAPAVALAAEALGAAP